MHSISRKPLFFLFLFSYNAITYTTLKDEGAIPGLAGTYPAIIQEIGIDAFDDKDANISNRLMLHGPAGTGKSSLPKVIAAYQTSQLRKKISEKKAEDDASTLAEATAQANSSKEESKSGSLVSATAQENGTTEEGKKKEDLDVPFEFVSASVFLSSYLGKGPETLKDKFALLATKAKLMSEQTGFHVRAILAIDEIDMFASKNTAEHRSEHRVVTQALNQALDEYENNKHIIFMCTTNYLDNLDPILKNRFTGMIVEIKRPDKENRKQFVKHYIAGFTKTQINFSNRDSYTINEKDFKKVHVPELFDEPYFEHFLNNTDKMSQRSLDRLLNRIENRVVKNKETLTKQLLDQEIAIIRKDTACELQDEQENNNDKERKDLELKNLKLNNQNLEAVAQRASLDSYNSKASAVFTTLGSVGAAGVLYDRLPEERKKQIEDKVKAVATTALGVFGGGAVVLVPQTTATTLVAEMTALEALEFSAFGTTAVVSAGTTTTGVGATGATAATATGSTTTVSGVLSSIWGTASTLVLAHPYIAVGTIVIGGITYVVWAHSGDDTSKNKDTK